MDATGMVFAKIIPAISLALVVSLTLWVTGFLFLLNIGLAIVYRKRHMGEVFSYYVAGAIELAIFAFVFLFQMGVINHVPYPLPQGLQFNRAEIGAALALGIGLFPAAYWHSSPLSQLKVRIAQDAKIIKARDGGVRVRGNEPGEWMN
jgi:hypothetical protein